VSTVKHIIFTAFNKFQRSGSRAGFLIKQIPNAMAKPQPPPFKLGCWPGFWLHRKRGS